MYANLQVTDGAGREYYAWKVEITDERRVVVFLDNNDGMGSYAEPSKSHMISPPVKIQACW